MPWFKATLLATVISLASGAAGPALAAGTTLRDYDSNLETARRATAGKLGDMQAAYLLGAAETMLAIMQSSAASGGSPLFCPKGRASLSLSDLTTALDQARATGGSTAPVQDLLIAALRKRWPCP